VQVSHRRAARDIPGHRLRHRSPRCRTTATTLLYLAPRSPPLPRRAQSSSKCFGRLKKMKLKFVIVTQCSFKSARKIQNKEKHIKKIQVNIFHLLLYSFML